MVLFAPTSIVSSFSYRKLEYSNNGYIILGAIIEIVSGQPYDQFLQQRIFDPLGMTNTGYEGAEIALGYDAWGRELPTPDLTFRYSAGGLYASVEDLYIWDQALHGGQILPQDSLEQIFVGYAKTPSLDFKDSQYGYGWFIGEALGRRVITHGGMMSGYTSMMLKFPDQNLSIIVLRNYNILTYDRLELELAQILLGE